MSRRDDKGIKRINADRYRELKYFCRQYPVWMKKIYEVEESIGIRGVKYDDMPHARNASSGVEQKVLQLNMLYAKVNMIDDAAYTVSPDMAEAIVFYCCIDTKISVAELKSIHGLECSESAFLKSRANFFRYLSMLKEQVEYDGVRARYRKKADTANWKFKQR